METDTMYVHPMGHAATCTCNYVQSKEDLQRNQSRGNSTCMKRIKLHLHNVCTCIRV